MNVIFTVSYNLKEQSTKKENDRASVQLADGLTIPYRLLNFWESIIDACGFQKLVKILILVNKCPL